MFVVMSFAFEFDRPDDEYFFAYSYPYTYTDLQRYLHQLERRGAPFFRRELLCKTIQHRRLDLITITSGAADHIPSTSTAHAGTGTGSPGAGAGAGAGAGGGMVAGLSFPSLTAGAHAAGGKPMVFITARVHPGESPAQFVCQVRASAGPGALPCKRM